MTVQETFREFSFEAAHATPPYSGLHGHSFRVLVALQGEPDPVFGWSHNLYEVEPLLDEVKEIVDHKYLNDVSGLEVPTLENVTRWMWVELNRRLRGVERVTVRRGNDGQAEGCTITNASPMAAAAHA